MRPASIFKPELAVLNMARLAWRISTGIRKILEALNFETVPCDEALENLQLKGKENVGF
ncbi:hypothetical protein [Arthrobacter sp. DR-2P]|uniref:hypothetical protein n=1 Tax=unclassified Arthrobacter TaxID=235627 RepID=UPI0010E0E179|nr:MULTISPECIES: hypothetical protein [unclassified Arthrobacter]VII97844.1 hypothetical protein [Arthrobacter sp. DR-2P]